MDTNVKENKKGKNGIILAVCIVVLVAAVIIFMYVLGDKKDGIAIEYKDPNGNVTGSVDTRFLSLMMAITNYQFGTGMLDSEAWETPYNEEGETLKDYIAECAVGYAEMLLESEYISDYIYGIGFSSAQSEDVNKFMSGLVSFYGSQEALENYLSGYGTNSSALRRFMELSMKQQTLLGALYASITSEEIMQHFEENYMVADHIMIKLQGEMKDDGTIIPLTPEEKADKIEYAKGIYNEIQGGIRDFETSIYEIGQDTYKVAFPDGYFIPKDGTSNLDSKVVNEIRVMKDGEIRFVETEKAVFIVRRNEMRGELCLASADFSAIIGSELAQREFTLQCQALDGSVIYDEVVSELDPSVIQPFNIDAVGQ